MVEPVSPAADPGPRAPRAGALVWVDFGEARGTEQTGVRPALVVSATIFNEVSRRSLVCPITRNVKPYPTKVALPGGLPIAGAVLADQVRSVDRAARGFRFIGQAPAATLEEVRGLIFDLLGDEGE